MGRSILCENHLLFPLARVHERFNLIPADRALGIPNQLPKAVFFLEGGIRIHLSGRRTHEVSAGDAYFSKGGGPLRYSSARPGCDARLHALVIEFRGYAAPLRKTETEFFGAIGKLLSGFHFFPAADWGNHSLECNEIIRLMEHPDAPARWRVGALCMALVADYLQDRPRPSFLAAADSASHPSIRAVEHVRQHIIEHLTRSLRLSDLAWNVRLSSEHLARLFKKHTGETVFGFIRRMRLEKARRLLATSDWPLLEVARQCGYSSTNLFCKHFKRHSGITPGAFRRHALSREVFSPSSFSSSPHAPDRI